MNTGSPDLTPFKDRVLRLLDEMQPGSGNRSGGNVLHELRQRIGSWVDERLTLYERERPVLQTENELLRGDLSKPSDIETLAERLAKVEDRLAREEELRLDVDGRITKVADIIGERVSGLGDELAAVQDLLGEKSRSPGALYYASRLSQLADAVRELNPGWRGWKGTDGPAFPTGGATTAEAATEAELPVPQRGDRVRLEDAYSVGGHRILNGWYECLGQNGSEYQVREYPGEIVGLHMFWVENSHPGLKEVRHADHT